MQCARCSARIPEGEEYSVQGQTVCEDCYLDAVASPKTCDPWAVYSATNLQKDGGVELTSTQRDILEELEKNGSLTPQQLCSNLGLDHDELQRNFATLRHLELARGFRDQDKTLYLTVFSDQDQAAEQGS
jgi:hypothetical protein